MGPFGEERASDGKYMGDEVDTPSSSSEEEPQKKSWMGPFDDETDDDDVPTWGHQEGLIGVGSS